MRPSLRGPQRECNQGLRALSSFLGVAVSGLGAWDFTFFEFGFQLALASITRALRKIQYSKGFQGVLALFSPG